MGSYLALTLSPMLASRSLKKNTVLRKRLEEDFNRLMEGRTIQQVYEQATLKYVTVTITTKRNITLIDTRF